MSFWNCILQWVYETNFLNEQGGIDSQLFTCCGSPAYAAPELVSGREYLGSEVRSRKGSRSFNGFWSRVLHFNFDNYFLFSLKFRIWMNCWHRDESCCPLIFILHTLHILCLNLFHFRLICGVWEFYCMLYYVVICPLMMTKFHHCIKRFR